MVDWGMLHNQRVVINCKNNLTYAGVMREKLELYGKQGFILELDEETHFSVWCPEDFVQKAIMVPIPIATSGRRQLDETPAEGELTRVDKRS
jgi:hypothetical protein